MNRAYRLALHWLLIVCPAGFGCRFRSLEGPVPRSLILSRQLSQQGMSAMERGNWARADDLLAQAVKVFPQDADARYHYAEVLWHRGEKLAAVEQLDKALQLAPDDPKLLLRAAQMRIAMGRPDEAGDLIQRGIDADSKNPAAWTLRGRLRRQAGERREALADYHRALGYRPDDRETLLEAAEVYRELNQPLRALATLQNLSDTYPPGEEPPQVLYLTGLAYGALGRHAEAVECLSLLRDRGAATTDALCQLAEAQCEVGRESEARHTAAQILAAAPGERRAVALLERLDVARHKGGSGYR
ncbi:MAG TPA: tetratricopeptide repeat protein [Pirellulales bacterium]|nr:tetratricopeptide repeat protein [Pirellulales bacterium]